MKKTFLILSLSAVLLLAACGTETKTTKKRENRGPIGDLTFAGVYEESDAVFCETEEKAKEAGAPDGFSGSVVKLTGKSSSGFTVDYTDNKTPAGIIESMTVRFFAPKEARKLWIRCGTNKIGEFVIHSNERGKWMEFTMTAAGENVRAGHSFEQFADKDGYLTTFDVTMDFVSRDTATAYVDSVTYVLTEYADSVPPVISYDGPTDIDMTAGKSVCIENISAFDKSDDKDVMIEYAWEKPEDADENGFPKEGKHKYYAIARDMDLNESRIEFNVNARPKDTEAPVIDVKQDEITVPKDITFDMCFTATDNEDGVIKCKASFDEKDALELNGCLKEGTHKLTLTATDLTGNESEKVITVIAK